MIVVDQVNFIIFDFKYTRSNNSQIGGILKHWLPFIVSGTARRIRADCGTENLNIAAIQRFFRRNDMDAFAGQKSFQFGKSTSNQVKTIIISECVST